MLKGVCWVLALKLSCFIEPTMGRFRGVGPLQIDTIDESRSSLVFAKIANTLSKWPNCYGLNLLKGVCWVLALDFQVVSSNRLWGVVGESDPHKLTPLTSPGQASFSRTHRQNGQIAMI